MAYLGQVILGAALFSLVELSQFTWVERAPDSYRKKVDAIFTIARNQEQMLLSIKEQATFVPLVS